MNTAIIFITNKKEQELAKANLFGKNLVDYTVSQIKRLDIETIYLIGDIDFEVDNVIKRDNVNEIIEELKDNNDKCLLVSALYPLIDKEEYEKILSEKEPTVFVDEKNELVPVFSIESNLLANYSSLNYKALKIESYKNIKFEDLKDIPLFLYLLKEKINNKWLNKGVIIHDLKNTIIGEDVVIDKNTIIYPNVTITGKCLIGKNNVIKTGCNLNNVVIGDNNEINNSTIVNSVVHNNVFINNYCHIDDNSEIFDNAKLGSSVRLNNTKVGKDVIIDNMSFLGNGVISDFVKIGAGVVTVNDDGRSKHTTIIKSYSVVGSNVSLIAPLTIGENAVIAAGSTIDQDVKDGDMAISRLYQQNKKGYGYKYTKED